jgi:hypothetical protein
MTDLLTLSGKIDFFPDNKTEKHKSQSNWKKVAVILIDGDITEYYSWFIKKRYNLLLKKPQRGAHITIINDSLRDMSKGGVLSELDVIEMYNHVAKKWNNKAIQITINLTPKTDDKYWWLEIPNENRDLLYSIREELNLSKPYWELHMTIGDADSTYVNFEHSKYIHNLMKRGYIT